MNYATRIAMLGVLLTGAAQAQPDSDATRAALTDEQRTQVEQIIDAQRERVQALLEEQREQLQARREAEREQRDAERDAERERQQALREQMQGIRDQTLADLEEVLEPEQLERMRTMIQRQMQGIAGPGADRRFDPRAGGRFDPRAGNNFRQSDPRAANPGRFPDSRDAQRNFRR